ncbi:PaaI family thioesterase [Actinomadura nitritigenes]|uniref:PaaI family thioesterase n=1 Tax=Actinomadura nitritigenes TaxID=134602 RepID=UPI003D89BF4C
MSTVPRDADGLTSLGAGMLPGHLGVRVSSRTDDEVTGELPAGADGFTTVELKTDFLGAAREGALRCRAVPVHKGRPMQLWDATVTDDQGRTVAVFRCTQLILWPR